MASFDETKDVVIDVTYNEHSFEVVHTLNYFDNDSMAIGEFEYTADAYPTELTEDEQNFVAEQISEHLTTNCSQGLSGVDDGETIYLTIED